MLQIVADSITKLSNQLCDDFQLVDTCPVTLLPLEDHLSMLKYSGGTGLGNKFQERQTSEPLAMIQT